MYFLMRYSRPISLLIGGYSYRKEFAPLGSKFFPLSVTPQIRSGIVSTIKVKNNFFIFHGVWKTVKCQGKVREF